MNFPNSTRQFLNWKLEPILFTKYFSYLPLIAWTQLVVSIRVSTVY